MDATYGVIGAPRGADWGAVAGMSDPQGVEPEVVPTASDGDADIDNPGWALFDTIVAS